MATRIKQLALAAMLACPLTASAYSNIYFFGDSLTDGGAFGGEAYQLGSSIITLPANARWTLGDGSNWADVLTAHYGLSSVANNSLNSNTSSSGNNYAEGGAQAQSTVKANTYGPGNLEIQELSQQIQDYLQQHGGKADPNALYSVWIGGNDVDAALGTGSSSTAQTVISSAAQMTAQSVGTLETAGARVIIVPNLPNLALTPSAVYGTVQEVAQALSASTTVQNEAIAAAWQVLSQGSASNANKATLIQQALAAANTVLTSGSGQGLSSLQTTYNTISSSLQQLSSGYNQLVDTDLVSAGLQHNIIRANMALLISEIEANPSRYGFSNTVGSACAQSAIVCSSTSYAQSYLFTDSLHPTPAAQAIIGNYIYGLLQAPYFAAALPQIALQNMQSLDQTLDGRYALLRHDTRAVGSVSAFADGATMNGNVSDGSVAVKPQGQLYTLGLDFQLSTALNLGWAVSRSTGNSNIDSTGSPGSVDDHTTLMTTMLSYQRDTWWLASDLHLGSGSLDTTRNIDLGPTTLSVDGNARQSAYGMRLQGGYLLNSGWIKTGPVASLSYDNIKIRSFAENGGSSSSMAFSDQNLSSAIARLGWQLETTLGRFNPYAKVVYAHQLDHGPDSISAGLTTTDGQWTTALGNTASNWLEWTAGLDARLGNSLNGWLQLTATSGNGSGNRVGGNMGLSMRF